jgi:hypothetical protein
MSICGIYRIAVQSIYKNFESNVNITNERFIQLNSFHPILDLFIGPIPKLDFWKKDDSRLIGQCKASIAPWRPD